MRTYTIYILLALMISVLLNSCSQEAKSRVELRPIEFNSKELIVISSSVSEVQNTMSVLYGNQQALAFSTGDQTQHISGEVFRLVTFRQQENELWYGSKINGELLKIETVSFQNKQAQEFLSYQVEYFNSALKENNNKSDQERISLIINQKAPIYP